jgi:hypothetical protein
MPTSFLEDKNFLEYIVCREKNQAKMHFIEQIEMRGLLERPNCLLGAIIWMRNHLRES